VSTDSERDQVTDRILKRSAIRSHGAEGGDACVDAETLAAWSDGALADADAAKVEAHLADCGRCQAMVAAFAASEPMTAAAADAAPVVVPFRSRSTATAMRWLIPAAVGTIAATLLVWTAFPTPDATVAPAETMASRNALQEEQPAGLAKDLSKSTTPSPGPAAAEARGQATSPARKSRAAAEERVAAPPTPSPIAVAPMAAPPPAGRPMTLPPQVQTDPAIARQTPVVTSAAASRSEVVRLDAIEAVKVEPTQSRVVAEFAPADPPQPGADRGFVGARGGAGGGGGGGGGRGAGGGATAVANRAPRIRWRVHASGEVTKSTNAGETWQPIAIVPPAIILNGASPSPTVCWLIGRAGIVMRSIDGVKFVRVAFPDVADLRSIKAVDAREATVTTVDGRVFTTMDGGENWTPAQDSLAPPF